MAHSKAHVRLGAASETRKRLGERIVYLREEQGFSQRRFSAMIELDHVSLIEIEAGRGNPTIITLARIAEGLPLTINDLFQYRQQRTLRKLSIRCV